ncbi:phospholipase A and acyltransferase 3-like [Saccostrea cucullata]|uniref:phospholipase A and acyltransferase 3-like n=1 Tax=Saccostrea cuccullata TaxID=36930 RepID=UPI002ED0DA04
MNCLHNWKVLNKARPGDLLEFPRGGVYSHWAVYVGDEEVVHLTGVDDDDGIDGNSNPSHFFSISGKTYKKAVVKLENFWKVVKDSKAKINNNKDRKYRPRPAREIVERAIRSIGKTGYNLLWKNCEHFAAYCRNGVEWSEQVYILNKSLL